MLIVLAILALVMSFAGPFVSRGTEGIRLKTASNELVAALRLTRSAAIVRNVETTLMIDVDKRVFDSSVTELAQRRISRAHILAWSSWRRAHQASACKAYLKQKDCNY